MHLTFNQVVRGSTPRADTIFLSRNGLESGLECSVEYILKLDYLMYSHTANTVEKLERNRRLIFRRKPMHSEILIAISM